MHATLDALSLWRDIAVHSLKEMSIDLSTRQNAILLTVYLAPPPHTIKSLSTQLGISKPAVCRAIDSLSLLQLVKRKFDENDKRNVLIQRTIRGSVYLSEFGEIITRALQPATQAASEAA